MAADTSNHSAPRADTAAARPAPPSADNMGEALGVPSADNRVGDLDPAAPDALSPEVRADGDGPVRGGMTEDTGAGAAGGRDRGGPGGREPERRPGWENVKGGAAPDHT